VTPKYDLVVVGAGTAAMGAAMRARKAGWSVAVIDFRPFGSTRAPRGCDPKKALLAGAETVDLARRMLWLSDAPEDRKGLKQPESESGQLAGHHRHAHENQDESRDYLEHRAEATQGFESTGEFTRKNRRH